RPRFAMSALGQKRTYTVHQRMSALPPIATSIAFFGMSALGQGHQSLLVCPWQLPDFQPSPFTRMYPAKGAVSEGKSPARGTRQNSASVFDFRIPIFHFQLPFIAVCIPISIVAAGAGPAAKATRPRLQRPQRDRRASQYELSKLACLFPIACDENLVALPSSRRLQ